MGIKISHLHAYVARTANSIPRYADCRYYSCWGSLGLSETMACIQWYELERHSGVFSRSSNQGEGEIPGPSCGDCQIATSLVWIIQTQKLNLKLNSSVDSSLSLIWAPSEENLEELLYKG